MVAAEERSAQIPLLLWAGLAMLAALDMVSAQALYARWWQISPYMWMAAPLLLYYFPPPDRYVRALPLLPLCVLAWIAFRLLGLLFGLPATLSPVLRALAVGAILALCFRRQIAEIFPDAAPRAAASIGAAAVVQRFWQDRPAHAALLICGTVTLPVIMAKALQWYGPAPRRSLERPGPPKYLGLPVAMLLWVFLAATALLFMFSAELGPTMDAVIGVAGLLLPTMLVTYCGARSWRRLAPDRKVHSLGAVLDRRLRRLTVAACLFCIWSTVLLLGAARIGYGLVAEATQVREQIRFAIHQDVAARTLYLDGPIHTGFYDEVVAHLDEHTETERIVISSPGGRVYEAELLAGLIRKLELTVIVDDHCESACTDILAAGKERWLLKGSVVGFHGPSWLELPVLGSAEEAQAYFEASGLPKGMAQMAAATPPSGIWYPSDEEMLRADVITRVVDSIN